jgi:hypothetical protein
MNVESVPAKFMRPRPYASRVGVSFRSIYHYVDLKVLPSYKFQGCLLLDVEECDAIIKGLRRREIKPAAKIKRQQGKKELVAK